MHVIKLLVQNLSSSQLLTREKGFVSSSWHITTNSMFAGSCIGIILLVMSLEFLRRLAKEYDRHILRQYQRHVLSVSTQSISESKEGKAVSCGSSSNDRRVPFVSKTFRPNMLQQFVRAILHTLQFAVAYLVMLLAMYYNGYFIICIIIGALLGSFVFSWESVDLE